MQNGRTGRKVKFKRISIRLIQLVVLNTIVGCNFAMEMTGRNKVVPVKSMLITVQPPPTIVAGETITPPIQVTYFTNDGNIDIEANQKTTVSLGSAPVGANIQNTLIESPELGVVNFDDLNFKNTGKNYTLKFKSESGVEITSSPFEVLPASPAKINITSAPLSVNAGECSVLPIEYSLLDPYNNRSPPAAMTNIVLSGTGLTFYSDSSCANPLASDSLSSGDPDSKLYVMGSVAGTHTVGLSSTGLSSASQPITVYPSAAGKLVFITSSQTLIAGTCSAAVTLETQDLSGNPSILTNNQTVILIGNGFTFYSDSSCTVSLGGSLVIDNGTSQKNFYFQPTLAGTILLSAATAGFTTATQNEIINPAPAVKLGFKVQPSHTVAGASINPAVEVNLLDQFNNLATTSSAAINIDIKDNPSGTGTLSGGAKTVNSSTGTSVFSGANSLSIHKTGIGYTLIATAPGLTSVTSNSFNITAGTSDHLAFITSPHTLNAGQCSGAVSYEVQDQHGNPTIFSAASIVSLSGTDLKFYSTPGCAPANEITSLGQIAGSQNKTFYFVGTKTGIIPLNIESTSGDILPLVAQNQIINPGTPTTLTFTSAEQTNVAGVCSSGAAFQATDTWNNLVATSANANITLNSTDTTTKFYSDATCATEINTTILNSSAPHNGTFYYVSTIAGENTLNVSGTITTGSGSHTVTGSQKQTTNHGPADHLSFTQNPSHVQAGESFTTPIAVAVKDLYGNNVLNYAANIVVDLKENPTSTTIIGGAKTGTPTNGVLTFTGPLDIKIETLGTGYTLSANSGSLAEIESTSFNITPAPPTRYRVLAGVSTLSAGHCSSTPLQIQFEDVFGNISALPATKNLSVSGTPSGINEVKLFTDATCTTPVSATVAAGQTTLNVYYKSKASGTNTLNLGVQDLNCNAVLGCTTADNAHVFTVNPDLPYQLAWSSPPIVSPNEVEAGSCSQALTLESRDQYGNVAPIIGSNKLLTLTPSSGSFYSDATCATALDNLTNQAFIPVGSSSIQIYFNTTVTAGGQFTATAQTQFSGAFAEGTASPYTSIVSQVHAIKAAPPDHFQITQMPLTSIAGQTLNGPFTAELRDRFENLAATSTVKTYVTIDTYDTTTRPTIYGAAGMTSAPTPANLGGTNYFPNPSQPSLWTNAVNGVVNYSGTKAVNIQKVGTYTLRLSALGIEFKPLTANTVQFVVNPAPADRLAFVTTAHSLTAGVCSGNVTIQARDPYDNSSNLSTDTVLTPSGTGMSFYSDSSCSTPITTVDIASGTHSATFYFIGTVASPAQNLTVTRTSGATLIAATQAQVITPDIPHHLAYSTTPRSFAAGVCSSAITFQAQDQFNNTTTTTQAETIALSQVGTPIGATLNFFSDATCATDIGATANLANSASTTTIYARGTVIGTVDVTGTPSFRPTGTATQTETIIPAPLSKIVYLQNETQTLVAGECSALSTIELRDAFENPIKGSPTTVSYSTSDSGITLYSDNTCATLLPNLSVPTNSSQASFYFKSTVAGIPRNLVLTVAAPAVSKTAAQNINPAEFKRFGFTNGIMNIFAATMGAGVCESLTIQAQDIYGNPVGSPLSSQRVVVRGSTADTVYYKDAGCTLGQELDLVDGADPDYPNANFITLSNEIEKIIYLKNIKAGTYTLEAVDSLYSFNGPFNLTVTAGVPHHLGFSPTVNDSTAGAPLESAPLTLRILDQYDNQTTSTGAVTLELDATNPNNAGLTLDGTLSATAINGAAEFATINIKKAGVDYSLLAKSVGLPNLTSNLFKVLAGSGTRLVITSAGTPVEAGQCSGVNTASLVDNFGNLALSLGDLVVDLDGQGMTFYTDAGCSNVATGNQITIANGTSSTNFYYVPTRSGQIDIDIASDANPGLAGDQDTQTITPTTASSIAFTTLPRLDIVAGSCSGSSKVISIHLKDIYGNNALNASGANYTFNFSDLSAYGIKLYTNNDCTGELSKTGGLYTFNLPPGGSGFDIYVSDNKTETLLLESGVAQTGWSAQQTVSFIPGVGTQLVFVTAPITGLVAGTCSSAISIQTQDAHGNPSPSITDRSVTVSSPTAVQFFLDATCATPIPAHQLIIAGGTHSTSYYVSSTLAANHTLQISSPGLTSGSQNLEVVFAAAFKLSFSVNPTNTIAGIPISPVLVQALDTYNNLVTTYSSEITLALDKNPSAGTLSGDLEIAATNGQSSFTDLSLDKIGTGYTLRATSGGLQNVESAAFDILSNTPHSLYFTTAAQTLDVNNCSAITSIGVKDSFSNITTVPADTIVNLTGSDFVFYSDLTCSNPITSTTILENLDQAHFYFKTDKAGQKEITVTSPGLDSATQIQTIMPGLPAKLAFVSSEQSVLSGECSAAVDIELQDIDGNGTLAISPVFITALGANFNFFQDANCLTPAINISIGIGESRTQLWFKGTAIGQSDISLTALGLSPSPTQQETILPGHGARLKFTSLGQTLMTNECSAINTFEVLDINGNKSGVNSSVNIDLTPSGGFVFYSDAGCNDTITSVTINPDNPTPGISQGSFYFKTGSQVGNHSTEISVYSTSSPQADRFKHAQGPDVLFHAVSPRPPTKIAILNDHQELRVVTCSAAVTVQTQDIFDNPSAVTSLTNVTLTSSHSLSFYSNSSCTNSINTTASTATLPILSSSSSSTFYIKSNVADDITITAATTLEGATAQDTGEFTITPASASRLSFVTTPSDTHAFFKTGECYGVYNLVLKDRYGNTAEAETVYPLVLSSINAQYYTDSNCTNEIRPILPSTDRVLNFEVGDSSLPPIYIRKEIMGFDNTVISSYSGLENAIHTFMMVPGTPTQISIVSEPQRTTAGFCSQAIVVRTLDAYGNEVTLESPIQVDFNVTLLHQTYKDSGAIAFYSDDTCSSEVNSFELPAGTARKNLYMRSTLADNIPINISNPGLTSATQIENVSPDKALHLKYTNAPTVIQKNICSPAFQAIPTDIYGNEVKNYGVPISLIPSIGTVVFFRDSSCTSQIVDTIKYDKNNQQMYQYHVIATQDATFNIASNLYDVPGAVQYNHQVKVVDTLLNQVKFKTSTRRVGGHFCSEVVTLELRDVNDAPLNVTDPAGLKVSLYGGGLKFFTSNDCTTAPVESVRIPQGQASTNLYFQVVDYPKTKVSLLHNVIINANVADPDIVGSSQFQEVIHLDDLDPGFDLYNIVIDECLPLNIAYDSDLFKYPMNISLNSTANLEIFQDAACTNTLNSPLNFISAGDTTSRMAYVKAKFPVGAASITLTEPHINSYTLNTHVVDKKLNLTNVASIAAGVCASATVQSLDYLNSPVAVTGSDLTVSLGEVEDHDDMHLLEAYSDVNCSQQIDSVTIPVGQTEKTVYLRTYSKGSTFIDLTTDITRYRNYTYFKYVPAASPTLLTLYSRDFDSLPMNSCSEALYFFRTDEFSNTTPVSTTTAINLSAQSLDASGNPAGDAFKITDVKFYSNPTCTNEITTVNIPSGEADSHDFYVKPVYPGIFALVGEAGPSYGYRKVTSSTERLAFVSPPILPDTEVYSCRSFTVQHQNIASGEAVDPLAPLEIDIQSGHTHNDHTYFNFYKSADCSGAGSKTLTDVINPLPGNPTPAEITINNTRTYSIRSYTLVTLPLFAEASGRQTGRYDMMNTVPADAKILFSENLLDVEAGVCSGIEKYWTPGTQYKSPRAAFQGRIVTSDATGNKYIYGSPASKIDLIASHVNFYSDKDCKTPITSMTVNGPTAFLPYVYFISPKAGANEIKGVGQITGDLAGIGGRTAKRIHASTVAQVGFGSESQTVRAGDCSNALSLQVQDRFGNEQVDSVDNEVSFIYPTGFTLYSDETCSTSIATAIVPRNNSTKSIWFRHATAESVSVQTRPVRQLEGVVQNHTILSGSSSFLGFITAPTTTPKGICSNPVTIQLQDSNGNSVISDSDRKIDLLGEAGAGYSFYTSNDCNVYSNITSIDLLTGQTSATFYFIAHKLGTSAIVGKSTDLVDAKQKQSITQGVPYKLAFSSLPTQNLFAGRCTEAVVLDTVDNYGELTSVSVSTTITLASDKSKFYSDRYCANQISSLSFNIGDSRKSFYTKTLTSGNTEISATDTNPGKLLTGYTSINLNPANIAATTVTTLAQALPIGACSTSVKIGLLDEFGNVTNNSNDPMLLTLSSGSISFYADNSCLSTLPGNQLIFAPHSTEASFYFKSNNIGSGTITVNNNRRLDPASQVQQFTAGTPSKLAFVTAPQNVRAGKCTTAITLSLQDLGNNETAGSADFNVALNAPVGGQFYSAAGCTDGSEINNILVPASQSRATVFLKSPTSLGTNSLSVTTGGLTGASQNLTTIGDVPSSLYFISAVQPNVLIETCSSAVTVGFRDAHNNATSANGDTTISLASSEASFYSDATCATAINSLIVPNTQNSRQFYYRPTQVGANTLTASATGITSATQTNTAVSGSASKLVFTSAANTFVAGSCQTATLQTRDNYNNPSTAGTARTINLAFSGSTAAFYASNDCSGTAANGVSLAANSSDVTFSYLITKSGNSNFTASSSGLAQALQTQTINPQAPIKLAFATTGRTVAANICSANITIQAQDTYGNPSAVSSTHSVNINPGALQLYADSDCLNISANNIDIANGTHSATFYFKSTQAGLHNIQISTLGLTNANQDQTINSDIPSKLVYLNAPLNIMAGTCAPLSMQVQDQFNNPSAVSGTKTVNYQFSGVPAQVYSDSSCTTSITSQTLNSGHTFGAYFKSSVSGLATIRISAAGLTLMDQIQTITAGSPNKISFATAPLTLSVEQCSGDIGPITLQVQDSLGNPSAVAAPVSFQFNATGFTFYSDANCGTEVTQANLIAGEHSKNIYFKTATAGTQAISLTMTGYAGVFQNQTINPLSATKLGMSVANLNVPTTVCSQIVIQTQDTYGNAVAFNSDITANLSVESGTFGLYSDASCNTSTTSVSIPSGTISAPAIYVRSNIAGVSVLKVMEQNALLNQGTQNITFAAGSPIKIALATPAHTTVANICSPATTIQTQDANNNPSPVSVNRTLNLTASPAVTPSSDGLIYYSDVGCTTSITNATITAGNSAVTVYSKARKSQTYVMTVTTSGFTSITQNRIVNPAVISNLAITSGANQNSVKAGECSSVVNFETRDSYGNISPATGNMTFNLAATNLSFYSDPSCSSSITQRVITTGASSENFYYKGTILGATTININGTVSTTASATIVPGIPTTLEISYSPTSLHSGVCSTSLTVRSKDSYSNYTNLSSSSTVHVATTPGTVELYSDQGCLTPLPANQVVIANGTSSSNVFYLKHDTAESINLISSLAGFTNGTKNLVISNTGPLIGIYDSVNNTNLQSGDTFNFGVAAMDTQKSFYLKNDGTTVTGTIALQLIVDAVNPEGIGSQTMWTLIADNCTGNTLNPGATCLVTIQFNAQSGTKPSGEYYYSNIKVSAAPKADGANTINLQIIGIKP